MEIDVANLQAKSVPFDLIVYFQNILIRFTLTFQPLAKMRYRYGLTPLLFFLQISVYAQTVSAPEGSYAMDRNKRLIVWHESKLDSIVQNHAQVEQIAFKSTYALEETGALSYQKKHRVGANGESFTLYISRLPLIQIELDTLLNSDTKVLGKYGFYGNKRWVKNGVGIEYRGNLSLSFPKKTYDLEFWNDSIPQQSRDLQFGNLRTDDDWILDGLYNEPLRLRSYVASVLWNAMHTPHYLARQPTAKSGADMVLVEVFINGEYQGIYTLSESIDRKLLALKKSEGQRVRGELFKASAYEGGPSFRKAPTFNNLFPHWAGFEMEYPLLDYRAHWDDLARLVDLVVTGTKADFVGSVGQYLNLDNAIDYFLFVNLLRATDNLGKNYYLARYDADSAYFFVPWDLDGVLGTIQDGKRIPTTDDILSNGLFDRLLQTDPDQFRKKVKQRWFQLRQDLFEETRLLRRIQDIYDQLDREGIYEREFGVWDPGENAVAEDYAYLQAWLEKRIAFLDTYFNAL